MVRKYVALVLIAVLSACKGGDVTAPASDPATSDWQVTIELVASNGQHIPTRVSWGLQAADPKNENNFGMQDVVSGQTMVVSGGKFHLSVGPNIGLGVQQSDAAPVATTATVSYVAPAIRTLSSVSVAKVEGVTLLQTLKQVSNVPGFSSFVGDSSRMLVLTGGGEVNQSFNFPRQHSWYTTLTRDVPLACVANERFDMIVDAQTMQFQVIGISSFSIDGAHALITCRQVAKLGAPVMNISASKSVPVTWR